MMAANKENEPSNLIDLRTQHDPLNVCTLPKSAQGVTATLMPIARRYVEALQTALSHTAFHDRLKEFAKCLSCDQVGSKLFGGTIKDDDLMNQTRFEISCSPSSYSVDSTTFSEPQPLLDLVRCSETIVSIGQSAVSLTRLVWRCANRLVFSDLMMALRSVLLEAVSNTPTPDISLHISPHDTKFILDLPGLTLSASVVFKVATFGHSERVELGQVKAHARVQVSDAQQETTSLAYSFDGFESKFVPDSQLIAIAPSDDEIEDEPSASAQSQTQDFTRGFFAQFVKYANSVVSKIAAAPAPAYRAYGAPDEPLKFDSYETPTKSPQCANASPNERVFVTPLTPTNHGHNVSQQSLVSPFCTPFTNFSGANSESLVTPNTRALWGLTEDGLWAAPDDADYVTFSGTPYKASDSGLISEDSLAEAMRALFRAETPSKKSLGTPQ
eukprot:c11330_g1_i1.p1 GENE.c11330_g1_i1~~c11330_g1_i1.p1  ORF type:complete len:457 (+),score=86.47 c11330_g1_i1:46-1371(+)